MTKVGTTDLRHDDENRQLIQIQITNKHVQKRQTNNAKQHKQRLKQCFQREKRQKGRDVAIEQQLHRDVKHLWKKW